MIRLMLNDVARIREMHFQVDFYKKDFEKVTSLLLTKPVSYGEAIKCLSIVIDSGVFKL